MAGVNKVILVGNLGADPEVRHLNNGGIVANINVATSETFTNRNGDKVTQTEWHKVELWDNLARVAEQFLRKGKQVYIEGKIKTDAWEDQEGNKRYTTKIRANGLQLLGNKNDDYDSQSSSSQNDTSNYENSGSYSNSGSGQGKSNQSKEVNPEVQAQEDDIDDLPF